MLDVSAKALKARESTEYPRSAWNLGYTGKGVTIAIMDTGVDDGHESLEGKFVAGADFTLPFNILSHMNISAVGNASNYTIPDINTIVGILGLNGTINPDDDIGHGTHVANIAMGTGGENKTYRGVAPDAKLVDIKVLSLLEGALATASVFSYDEVILQGLEWCILNRNTLWKNQPEEYSGIDIISMSFGVEGVGSDGSDLISRLVNIASREFGIVTIAAAGNEGAKDFQPPAAADEAITVGAIDDKGTVSRDDDVLANYSNTGPRKSDRDVDISDELKPDVVAPGTNITSAKYSLIPFIGAKNGYMAYNGTSMAAPHVAGVVALMLEANPNLSPREIKKILRETATQKGTPYNKSIDAKYSPDYGYGIVDAYMAVKKAIGNTAPVARVAAIPQTIRVNQTVFFDASNSSDPYVSITSYNFNFGDGVQTGWGSSKTASHKYTSVGQYTASLSVKNIDSEQSLSDAKITITVRPKNVLPEVAITSHKDGDKIYGTTTISGVASDSDGKIESVEIKIDNTNWTVVNGTASWFYNLSTISLNNGSHTIGIRVYDGEEYSKEQHIALTVDNHIPYCTITNPRNGDKINGTFLISGTAYDIDPGDGINSVYVKVESNIGKGSTEWIVVEKKFVGDKYLWNYTWDTSNFYGNTTVYAYVVSKNNEKSLTANTTVETHHPPTLTAIYPQQSEILRGEVTIRGSSRDFDIGDSVRTTMKISNTTYSSGWIQPTIFGDYWSVEWDTKGVLDGVYVISVYASDGEFETTLDITITVKNFVPNKPPSIAVASPKDGTRVSDSVSISGTAWDNDGEVKAIYVNINNGPWQIANGTKNWEYLWNATNLPKGNYTIYAKSNDGKENSEIASITVILEEKKMEKEQMEKGGGFVPFIGVNAIILIVAATVFAELVNKCRKIKKCR
jgi:subtilisin family serine protease